MKIAIIGAGNMGMAIASSLVGENAEIVCTAKTDSTIARIEKELPQVTAGHDNKAAVMGAYMIVLAVKPYLAKGVIEEIKPFVKPAAAIVSVMSGISISELSEAFDAPNHGFRVFRVIPNTAIRMRESVTFIAHADNCDSATLDEIERIFRLSGETFVIPEKDMAVCTSIASCGIAFFLRFIRAMAEGGVELGLPAAFATRIAALTARSAEAVLRDGSHPEAEIDKVTTPGGITIKGLNEMEHKGLTSAIIAGLKATLPK